MQNNCIELLNIATCYRFVVDCSVCAARCIMNREQNHSGWIQDKPQWRVAEHWFCGEDCPHRKYLSRAFWLSNSAPECRKKFTNRENHFVRPLYAERKINM